MGLFDFVRDVGSQVFTTDADAAKKIKEYLEIKASGITGLDCTYDDGIASLSGECINQATKDMAVKMAGNIKGVKAVNADQLTVKAPKPRTEPTSAPVSDSAGAAAEFYTIEKGDTLGAIAKRFLGKASAYTKIFEANKDIISDPNKIFPGQKIRIPRD